MVEFPGVGVGTAWSVGHPEAVTLPRWRPDISNCFPFIPDGLSFQAPQARKTALKSFMSSSIVVSLPILIPVFN